MADEGTEAQSGKVTQPREGRSVGFWPVWVPVVAPPLPICRTKVQSVPAPPRGPPVEGSRVWRSLRSVHQLAVLLPGLWDQIGGDPREQNHFLQPHLLGVVSEPLVPVGDPRASGEEAPGETLGRGNSKPSRGVWPSPSRSLLHSDPEPPS